MADWRERVAAAKASGYDHLWQLTAVDEIGHGNHIRVSLWLRDDSGQQFRLDELVDREDAHLADIADLFPGACWLQRQIHDFFGVVFDGGDNSPLLVHEGGAPLRKDVLLQPRLETRWPGALEPGEATAAPSRRRLVPAGVPDPKVLADPNATAEEVAQSAAGVRAGRKR